MTTNKEMQTKCSKLNAEKTVQNGHIHVLKHKGRGRMDGFLFFYKVIYYLLQPQPFSVMSN